MGEIQLVDNRVSIETKSAQGGHAYRYLNQLLQIEGTVWNSAPKELCTFAPNPIMYVAQRKKYLSHFIGSSCIHFLQLDEFYKAPSVFKFLKSHGIYIIATMHHYPTSWARGILLKRSSKFIDKIIVHSAFIKKTLEKMGIKSEIEVINYPVFDKTIADIVFATRVTRQSEKKTFLCLGDTRIDKGLNVLIDAFSYLPRETKERCRFVVAGKEKEIRYQTLLDEARKYDIEVFIEPGFITDQHYWELIHESDIILLPYTRLFTGASGPLTDGVYGKKQIIGCDFGNIGETIKKNELGTVFVTENSQSLAKELTAAIRRDWIPSERYKAYRETLEVESFMDSYQKIYQSIKIR